MAQGVLTPGYFKVFNLPPTKDIMHLKILGLFSATIVSTVIIFLSGQKKQERSSTEEIAHLHRQSRQKCRSYHLQQNIHFQKQLLAQIKMVLVDI